MQLSENQLSQVCVSSQFHSLSVLPRDQSGFKMPHSSWTELIVCQWFHIYGTQIDRKTSVDFTLFRLTRRSGLEEAGLC